MIMIHHQAIGSNPNIPEFYSLLEQIKEHLAVPFFKKNVLSPPATVHHMVPGIRILYSQRSSHMRLIAKRKIRVKRRLDPFLVVIIGFLGE
jgi:hypothetical protein